MNSKLVAYAGDFTSFLIQKVKDLSVIKNVILFGSIARGTESKNSDIDVFVDMRGGKNIEKEISQITKEFYNSVKYKNYWKLLGIENEIKVISSVLEEWKDLKESIVSNGITLYGKFKAEGEGEHKVLLSWENVKPNSKRVLFNKQMLGYRQNGKFYQGLMQKYGGEKWGKGNIIVPLDNSQIFLELFKRHKITVKIKRIVVS